MNIVYISFENVAYSGRTLEVIKVARKMGHVYGIVVGKLKEKLGDNFIYYPEEKSFLGFIKETIKMINRIKNIDIVMIDNRRACVPAILAWKKLKKSYVVYDMWELYLLKDRKSIVSKLGCLPERRIVKKANLVICANKERADIVKTQFNGRKTIVFENIRKLEYSDTVDLDFLENKYKDIFYNNKFKIISTAGTSIVRGNGQLVMSTVNMMDKVEIILVGGEMEPGGNKAITRIIKENNMRNIILIDKVGHDELKYLISKSDCGVVNYHQNDINNKYCASGKIYEYIFEGKPIIATSNPPLYKFVNKTGIGVSGDDYAKLICQMITNYEQYLENVTKIQSEISVDENNNKLMKTILNYYGN